MRVYLDAGKCQIFLAGGRDFSKNSAPINDVGVPIDTLISPPPVTIGSRLP